MYETARHLAAIGRAVAAAASACLVLAPAAAATAIDFESPPIADGVPVQAQFPGVEFRKGTPYNVPELPEVAVSGAARSPTRALDISTQKVEFPTPALAGTFASSRSQVSVWVRNVTQPALAARLKLQAFNAANGLVAESGGGAFTLLSPSDSWKQLSVAVASPSIAWFRVASQLSEGHTILVDDLSFDDPVATSPDFSVSSPLGGFVVLPRSTTRTAPVSIARLNGSTGDVSFSASGLPVGVSASFAPNPVGGTGSATTLSLTASASAHLTDGPVPITVAASPAGPAVGPATRTLTLPIDVRAPVRLHTAAPAEPIPLYPCEEASRQIFLHRESGVTDAVALEGMLEDGSPLPAGLTASFEPATVAPPASSTALRLRRGDGELAGHPFETGRLLVRGSIGGSAVDDLLLAVRELPPEVTAVEHADAALAPQGLRPGSHLRVFGRGFCPGSSVEFGNEEAPAPLTGIRPAPGRPGEMEGVAVVPRLATDGNATLVTPAGLRSPPSPSNFVEALAYRDTNGFSFKNDDWRDPGIRGYQELFGPRQSNLTLNPCWPFDCTIVTPILDPVFFGFTEIADLVLAGSGGTCVGYSVASVRMTAAAHRSRLRLPDVSSVWRLPSSARLRGRGDMPLESPFWWGLGRWLDIQHINQIGAEFLNTYLTRVAQGIRHMASGTAAVGAVRLRADLERELRAGRRPVMLMRKDLDSGHAVVAYDVEPDPGGGFLIRVYDNNLPFTAAELQADGRLHKTNEEISRIAVRPNGTWSYPKPRRNGELANWSGTLGTLVWTSVETELPLEPTVPWTLDGITTVFGASAPVERAGAARAAARRRAGVVPFVPLDVSRPKPVYLANSGGSHAFDVVGSATGVQEIGLLGDDRLVHLSADGRQGASGRVTALSRNRGVRYSRSSPTRLRVDLLARPPNGAVRRARLSTGPSGGTEVLRFGTGDGSLHYRHSGEPTTVRLELEASGRAAPGRFASGRLRIRSGDRLTLRPNWNRLDARRLTVSLHRRGRKRVRVLGNRLRPALVVRSLRVRAQRRGRTAVLTLRARLRGRRRGATVAVSGIVLRGRRIRARGQRLLRDPAGGIRTRLLLPLRAGDLRRARLRVRVGVAALSAKGRRTVSFRAATAPLR